MRNRVFIFDLDNTLHDASRYVLPQINQAMTRYIREQLQIDEEQAHHLRQVYWRRYGATLRGLMHHHGTNPYHFLRETHRFDNLESLLVTDARLLRALRRLRRRKILFSNAPRHYVEAVLRALGVHDVFQVIHCIEDTGFRPKPHLHGFRKLVGRARLDARRCVFVDDSADNLLASKRLQMRTVHIADKRICRAGIDVWVRTPRKLACLLAGVR